MKNKKKKMNYGLPYMGSKNTIAKKIIDVIPPCDTFVDLFFGGGAITHAAIVSGKFKHFIVNDIQKEMIELFLDAIDGKFAHSNRWISREEFFDMKDYDTYVSVCWSFGNNRKTYLYGKHIEPYKKAYWYARVLGDFSLFEEMGIYVKGDDVRKYIREHKEEVRSSYINYMKQNYYDVSDKNINRLQDLQSLERLQSLEHLQSLQSHQSLERIESLETYFGDYRDVAIPDNSIIYCDPPYANTQKYLDIDFNHQEFYDWCLQQNQPIVISEYDMPKPFICVKEMSKMQTFGDNKKITEKLYTIPKFVDYFKSKELTLF